MLLPLIAQLAYYEPRGACDRLLMALVDSDRVAAEARKEADWLRSEPPSAVREAYSERLARTIDLGERAYGHIGKAMEATCPQVTAPPRVEPSPAAPAPGKRP